MGFNGLPGRFLFRAVRVFIPLLLVPHQVDIDLLQVLLRGFSFDLLAVEVDLGRQLMGGAMLRPGKGVCLAKLHRSLCVMISFSHELIRFV